MALDPNIALGVRPLELPNQLAQYAQVSQIQNAQNQNALAQYQLGSAQRAEAKDIARTAALSKAGTNDTAIADALLKSGDLAGYTSFVKTRRETQKADVDLVDAKLKQARGFLDTINPADPNAPAQYIAWHQANHADPVLGPVLKARGSTPEQSMARIQQAIQAGPQAFANLLNQSMLGTEKFMELNKPSNITVNQGGQTQLLQAPGLGGALVSRGTYADVPLPAAVEAQKLRIARAGATVLPAQEKAFEAGLGAGQSKLLLDNKVAALDAASIIDTVNVGRGIMKSGMITGAGADFLVNLNQGLKTVGIDAGYADAAANSQAFTATLAGNVGKLIKQFGAGTGLSDADREFAKDMAGGRIALDAKAIDKILNINERAARNVITRHNKDVKGIKTNIPLEVEMPPEIKAPAAGNAVTNPQFPGFSIGK